MATIINDTELADRLKAERRETGADRYDEVWEGVYMMAPMPNTEHQQIVSRLVYVFEEIIGWPGLGLVVPGVNLSDREQGWRDNYRVPDVAVALDGGKVRDCGSHWCGGPEFVVEVVSPEDQTRDKFPFYGHLGVGELLLIDRDPWALELYRPGDQTLQLAGRSVLDEADILTSSTIPITMRLVPGTGRPSVELTHLDSDRRWEI